MPYFITASGLFSLGMENGGSRVVNVNLRSGDDVYGAEMKEHELATAEDGIPVSPSHVEVSAAAHASLLLAKMSTTHPAAAVAKRMLEQEIELKHRLQQEEK